MRNLGLTLVKWLYKILALLGLRSQRHWGIVYDSITKQPVDPVVVKLLDARTGKVLGSSTANMHGEYGFMANPGLYKIFVQRPHFNFPSKKITSQNDGIYTNVYTGQTMEFTGGSDVISLNIPLDPVAQDFNQQAKLLVVNDWPRLERLVQFSMRFLFVLSFVYAVVQYFFGTGNTTWAVIVAVLLGILLLARITPEVRLWGRVVFKKTGAPAPGANIVITHPTLPGITIAQATTTIEGKFFIRLQKGKYHLNIIRPGLGDAQPVMFSKSISIGSEGLLNREFYV